LRMRNMLSAMNAMSMAATFQSIRNSKTTNSDEAWPFVTMVDFDQQGANTLALANTLQVALSPRVLDVERKDWETYSVEHLEWFAQGMARKQRFETGKTMIYKTTNTTTETSNQIYKLDSSTSSGKSVADKALFYFPVWQRVPLDAVTVNLDMLAQQDDGEEDVRDNGDILAIQHMMSAGDAVLARMQDVTGSKTRREAIESLIRYHFQDPNATYQGDPITSLFYPVFDSFDMATHELMAMFSTTIYWPAIFHRIIPSEPHDGDLIVVLKNNCGDVLTYQVNDNESVYLGPQDFHYQEFDSLEFVYHMAEAHIGLHDNAPRLTTNFCSYTWHVYPSEEFHHAHVTSSRTNFTSAGIVAAWFVLATLIGMAYNRQVERRAEPIMAMARQADAIVSAHFPEAFRERLLGGNKNSSKKNKSEKASTTLDNSMLPEPVEGNSSGEGSGKGATTVVAPHLAMVHMSSQTPLDQSGIQWDSKPTLPNFFPIVLLCLLAFLDLTAGRLSDNRNRFFCSLKPSFKPLMTLLGSSMSSRSSQSVTSMSP
jgi:hypothetical protein